MYPIIMLTMSIPMLSTYIGFRFATPLKKVNCAVKNIINMQKNDTLITRFIWALLI